VSLLAKFQCDAATALTDPEKGPPVHAIAVKYTSDPHARDDLAGSVLNGSVRAGPIPMAGYPVPKSDGQPLIDCVAAALTVAH